MRGTRLQYPRAGEGGGTGGLVVGGAVRGTRRQKPRAGRGGGTVVDFIGGWLRMALFMLSCWAIAFGIRLLNSQ